MSKVVIIGPAHPLRGGLASFDERLAKAFSDNGDDATIYTFSFQYPKFLFPGTTQFSSEPAPENIKIKVCINSVNPANWIKVGLDLKKFQADIIVVRYWLPFMGPGFGTILRIARSNKKTKIICIADNVIPHEHRIGDKQFTQYFLKPVDAFITMSGKVMNDLRTFTDKPSQLVVHPLYDNFGEIIDKKIAREKLNLDLEEPIILFFGFIRKYKGLDLLFEAMAILNKQKNDDLHLKIPKLLVAGEFYEGKKNYEDLIDKLGIRDMLILHTDFISDSKVKYYLCAADFVIQPYKNATQSGVTPLAYHFEKPMLVTNVGGLPDMVPDRKAGLVCEPNAADIAKYIMELYQLGEDYFLPQLREEKKKYSWEILVNEIKKLADT